MCVDFCQQEEVEGKVNVRTRDGQVHGLFSLDDFAARVEEEIQEKK